MTLYDDIRNSLQAHGVTTTYTDQQLAQLVSEAKSLVNSPITGTSQETDYVPDFTGNTYLTDYYPVIRGSVTLLVNGENVTPRRVTPDGRIYLPNGMIGELECTYTTGLDTTTLNSYLVPIVVGMITGNENQNLASISEGDVSISYRSEGSTSADLDQLVANLRGLYGARVRLL